MQASDFVRTYGVTMTTLSLGQHVTEGWDHTLWTVVLTNHEGGKVGMEFRTGSAIGSVDLPDLLICLSSEASASDAGSFEEWADEFGYNTDSRSAEATYRACRATAEKMDRWCTSDHMRENFRTLTYDE